LDRRWLDGYASTGIELLPASGTGSLWWDQEVLEWIVAYGPRPFRKLDIWDVDWPRLARSAGREVDPRQLQDPRRRWERGIHRWLARTQGNLDSVSTRWLQRLLIVMGW
jgi:hypothetical protein